LIRATVDTNTLASGAVAKIGAIADLIKAWRIGFVEIVVSEHILIELERTLRKPYFSARLDEFERRAFLALLLEFATVVEITASVPTVVSDYGDNVVLATALSAKAPYVVTGDRELQRLSRYQAIRIVSAREFLDIAFSGSEADTTHEF
jgi:putative PIN family toxin of toxin-antitoxin system